MPGGDEDDCLDIKTPFWTYVQPGTLRSTTVAKMAENYIDKMAVAIHNQGTENRGVRRAPFKEEVLEMRLFDEEHS